jgi:putative DNA primase/helicase
MAAIEIVKTAKEGNKDQKIFSDQLNKRSYSLRSARRCKSVFELISPMISLNGEWDHCPGKLPCLNGVIDLNTGNLVKHDPNFLIRSVCPISYNPNAHSPLFENFLDDITLGNLELKAFLGRVLGSALLGIPKEERVFIFYGKEGRNGKGTLMQTLEKILGPLAKTFPSEMLLLQRNPPSSSTPRPEKANLQGVRFAIFSEIDEKRQIDASEIKNLTGGDTITCRRLFSNVDIQIKPSHTMFIQTNFKPKASAKDGALWKRNILIPFNAEFVEEHDQEKPHQRKKDEGFKEKLLIEKEGILAWLIKGCLEYQKIGLLIPEIVKNETETYRKENDGIQLFLEEMCIQSSEFSTYRSKMTAAIQKYCRENGYEAPNRKEISATLGQKFKTGHNNKGDFWCGIKIHDEEELHED